MHALLRFSLYTPPDGDASSEPKPKHEVEADAGVVVKAEVGADSYVVVKAEDSDLELIFLSLQSRPLSLD